MIIAIKKCRENNVLYIEEMHHVHKITRQVPMDEATQIQQEFQHHLIKPN